MYQWLRSAKTNSSVFKTWVSWYHLSCFFVRKWRGRWKWIMNWCSGWRDCGCYITLNASHRWIVISLSSIVPYTTKHFTGGVHAPFHRIGFITHTHIKNVNSIQHPQVLCMNQFLLMSSGTLIFKCGWVKTVTYFITFSIECSIHCSWDCMVAIKVINQMPHALGLALISNLSI